MERFGASVNYCAQRPESLLIPVEKNGGTGAKTSQWIFLQNTIRAAPIAFPHDKCSSYGTCLMPTL